MTSKQLIASIAAAGTLLTGGIVNNAQLQAQDDVINPYVENADNFEARVKANKVLVDKNAPKITLEKWNNKDYLGVSYTKKKSKGKTVRKELTKITQYDVDNKESVVMEPTEDGFNIDISLNSKPSSNVFTYQFENWQDKDFFYQPELTQEEKDQGAERPENVVGSYAVYSKEKRNHILGQTNYETGKLFHIYRPLVSDANGSTTWATLNISDGVMTITVPQEFLDGASYPVLVDPTFGYTTQGTAGSTSFEGVIVGSVFSAPEAGTVTQIDATIQTGPEIHAGLVGIYNTSYSLITNGGSSAVSDLLDAKGWQTFTFTSNPSITATDYVLIIHGNVVGFSSAVVYYDAGSANQGLTDSNAYTGSALSSFASPTLNNNKYSIYATYTADTPASASTTLFNIQSGTVKINSGKVIR